MRIKRNRFILLLLLVPFVSATAYFLGLTLLIYLAQEDIANVTIDDIHSCLDSLDSDNCNNPDVMKDRAYELATILFDDPDRREEFAHEVTEIYFDLEGKDFLLVYNTGGFGGGTMEDDPEWPGILEGVETELDALGYSSMVMEHQRSTRDIIGFFGEVNELADDYPLKTLNLAAKMAFLTKYKPDLKIIITGRCFGAIFSNEVMELEKDNLQLYSIQAGVPFWYTDPGGERTLVIEDNGTMPDTLHEGNSWTFLSTVLEDNLGKLPSTSPSEEGSVQILMWYFDMPGHTYTWEHEEVQSEIVYFLEENFGSSLPG